MNFLLIEKQYFFYLEYLCMKSIYYRNLNMPVQKQHVEQKAYQ
jgi:hypothetical protein